MQLIGPEKHMNGTILKDPDSELTLSFDWRAGYLKKNETVVDDLGWTVQPVDDDPNCLKIIEQTLTAHGSRAVLTGGVSGQVYLLTCAVGTDAGRVLKRGIILRIGRKDPTQQSGEFHEID
ncbi:MAG: hypothetical protein JKY31_12835 [Rhodobacteraceae bacterium]|nr:hypothetical protein [Paracoccaceae bacterium]